MNKFREKSRNIDFVFPHFGHNKNFPQSGISDFHMFIEIITK